MTPPHERGWQTRNARIDPRIDALGWRRLPSGTPGAHSKGFPATILAVFLVVLIAPALGAQPSGDGEGESPSAPPSSNVFVAFPDSNLYPQYVADPLRAQSALIIASIVDSEIPDAGDSRFILRLGGNFSLFRVHPEGTPDRGFQVDFHGGFFGHFDRDFSLDNIGWDGLFGLLVTWKPRDTLAFRAGTLHDSAHVGDEYAERTGRTRIGYTREEWVAAVNWAPSERWRAYAEGGYGMDLEEFQEPLRLQAGVEIAGTRRFWWDRARWYGAIDVGAFEESEWDPRITGQAGVMIDTGRGSQRYRLALEYGDGRSALGEFFMHDETYVSVGFYFDF